MAANSDTGTAQGPKFEAGVTELVAMFPNDAALEDAVSRLTLAGFDRADLSLPVTQPGAGETTPETGAAPVYTDTDRRQARTLATSTAASAAAIGAAGLTAATGGAAAAVIAAAAIGGGAVAAAVNAIGQGSEGIVQANHDMAGEAGELRLSVRIASPERLAVAERALREAGGRKWWETPLGALGLHPGWKAAKRCRDCVCRITAIDGRQPRGRTIASATKISPKIR